MEVGEMAVGVEDEGVLGPALPASQEDDCGEGENECTRVLLMMIVTSSDRPSVRTWFES
jgi:hypothetical protein